MKRDDLLHPIISGNKYRKLAFLNPILEKRRCSGVVSFGGPHSNHLHALAWLCKMHDVPLTVMVRSHGELPRTPTLTDVQEWGGAIRAIRPELYREKDREVNLNRWRRQYPDHIFIPEGGSHPHALDGVKDMMDEIEVALPYADLFFCPVGTGATLAGMVRSLKIKQKVVGVSAIKSSVLDKDISNKWNLGSDSNWIIADQWHFGGYGKMPEKLIQFVSFFKNKHGITLDLLYNGKTMFGFYQYVKYNLIPSGSNVVFIHTGGLQGLRK